MTSRAPKPEPVVVTTICSLCDLPWEDHGDNPTTADCIFLLKNELARRPLTIFQDRWHWPNTWNFPSVTYPTYSTGGYVSYDNSNLSQNVIELRRPDDDDGLASVPAVP